MKPSLRKRREDMAKNEGKKKRTTGFKLGVAQAVLYLVAALSLLVTATYFEIDCAVEAAEVASSYINYLYRDEIDWNDDGEYFDNDAELYTTYESVNINYADKYKGKPFIQVRIGSREDENGYTENIYEYYDFVSEDMKSEQWVFAKRGTGEEVTVKFSQSRQYSNYLYYVDEGMDSPYTHIMDYCLLGAGALIACFAVMQFIAAFKGSKSYHANNLGIAINVIFFGFGALGLAGAIKDRKLALANDEKYIARQRVKEAKRREREEKELAENGGSTFTGGAFANAGINMLTGFVCIITLGLAYPAMVCWKLRWKCAHTFVSGRQLVFDGKGIQFFGKYLLWEFLSIITLGIYYVVCMKVAVAKWQTKHTHFADTVITEESENLSKFDGHWFQLLGVNWLCRFVTLITLSFGQYWAHCYSERWYAKHKTIDGSKLKFDGKAMQYFGKRFVWILLTIVTLGIYAFWLSVKTEKWTCSHTKIDENND